MKKRLFILFILMYLCFPIVSNAIATNSSDISYIRIYLFSNNKCKECDSAKEFLDNYRKDNYRLNTEYINIDDNKELNNKVKDLFSIKKDSVPLIVIGSNYFIGFNDNIKEELTSAIKAYEEKEEYCDVVSKLKNGEDTKDCINQNKDIYKQKNTSGVSISTIIKVVTVCILVALVIGVVFIFMKKKNK